MHRLKKTEEHKVWKQNQVQEWYFISFLFTGSEKLATDLVRETIEIGHWGRKNNPLKPLLTVIHKKSKRGEELTVSQPSFPLTVSRLKALQNVPEWDRLVLILKYIKGYSLKQIARLLRTTKRRVQGSIFQHLHIWNVSKYDDLQQLLEEECKSLQSYLMEASLPNKIVESMEKEKEKKYRYRWGYILLFTLSLLIGGTLNVQTIDRTRANTGAEMVTIFEHGGVFNLSGELIEQGFHNVSIFPNIEEKLITVTSYSDKYKEEEIIAFIETYLKERNLHYDTSFSYEEITNIEEDLEQEEELDPELEQENQFNNEVLDFISSKFPSYSTEWMSEEEVVIVVSDQSSEEEKQQLKEGLQAIYKKYDKQTKITINTFDSQKQDMEQQWWEIAAPIYEAFLNNKKYQVEEVWFEYIGNVMEIRINTTLLEEDKTTDQLVKEIEHSLHYFLQNEAVKEVIGETPYRIMMYSMNNELINRKRGQ